ncbi:hypothetical protein QJS10_CPA10g00804 [Acorus calamus]|uniref:Uncharacterized protein n=1 Tax=Acorus calamus TaxID=4465 RepID=A0AAV9DZT8_ACOCL|nr:hypothetical protein QJS10_CPA10g00804 [Acorus calamus]
MGKYARADFVIVDCKMEGRERVLGAARAGRARIVVGYNAFCDGSWWRDGEREEMVVPIGEGLRVCRVVGEKRRRRRWVVRVDECTGEEHVFRIVNSQRKGIRA